MLKEIKSRKSTRKYKDTPVSEEQVIQLLESARLAPSGTNTQPWNFIIVRDEDNREEIAKICGGQMWMTTAPVYIVCVADIRSRVKEEGLYIDEKTDTRDVKAIIRDTAIAITHILLEAEALGLSTCWIAHLNQADLRPALDMPNDKYIVGVITVGYSDEDRRPTPRRNLESMIRYEKW